MIPDLLRMLNVSDEPASGFAALGVVSAGLAAGAYTGMHKNMLLGAAYSFGGEAIVGELGFGYSISDLSASDIRNSAIVGTSGGFTVGNPSNFGASGPMLTRAEMTSRARSVHSSTMGRGIMKQSFMSSAFPVASLLYGGISAYSDEGVEGLGKYMVSDFLGNYYGTQASLQTYEVAGAAEASTLLGTAVTDGQTVARINPLLGSPMLGRILPTLGGITGSVMGMDIGANVGSAIESIFSSGEPSKIGSIGGGILGAIAGAKFGAYMTSSLGGLMIGGGALLATSAIVSTTMSSLEAGFKNIGKNRGLGFAGDTASYFTRNAVTMRERAVQAMHKSHLNARSAFGQEANIIHMNRDMFSHHRR